MKADMLPMLCGHSYQTVPTLAVDHPADVKLDGWRAIVHLDGDGHVHLYGGRNGSDYSSQLPYLEAELAEILPLDSVVDGELISVTDCWGMVQSIMTTGHPHQPSAHQPALRYYVFDVLRLGGMDARRLPWTARRALVEQAARGELVTPTLLVPATNDALAVLLEEGYEGMVLKNPNSTYVHGRSPSWAKVKPQQTAEARIIGFKPGKAGGSLDGMVGAFEVELLDNGVRTTIKCGDNARHRDATEHPEKWFGQVIEFKHHGLSKTGSPRHPQYLRLRGDLMPEATTPTAPVTSAPARGAVRTRNYGAMKDEKLLRCIEELSRQRGDAYERALSRAADPDYDLGVATSIAAKRGLI